MSCITNYQESTNQNKNEISPHTSKEQKQTVLPESMEKDTLNSVLEMSTGPAFLKSDMDTQLHRDG